jgi:hypothetical protein
MGSKPKANSVGSWQTGAGRIGINGANLMPFWFGA